MSERCFLSTAAYALSLAARRDRAPGAWPIFHENRFGRRIRQYPDVRFGPNTVHDRTTDPRIFRIATNFHAAVDDTIMDVGPPLVRPRRRRASGGMEDW